MNILPTSPVWLAFITGIILGAFGGVFVLALCIMQTRNDVEGDIMARNMDQKPREERYYKYPVLIIPTEQGTDLVIGMAKARAAIRHYRDIVAFVEKHEENYDGASVVVLDPQPAPDTRVSR